VTGRTQQAAPLTAHPPCWCRLPHAANRAQKQTICTPQSAVTEAGGVLGRSDDAGEQQRGKDPVRRDRFPDAGEELADLGHDVVAIGPWGMIGAGQFNVFAVANMAGQEAGVFYVAHDSATDTTQ
jgi:hypothetical protein